MRFNVEEYAPDRYMIVPDGHEPIPAIFESREAAQEIADVLRMHSSLGHEKQPGIASGAKQGGPHVSASA